MARVSNTLIGKSSGRVGNAVFSTWKGINVLKEKPASVANPDTDNQQMRRSALRQTVAIFRVIAAVVNLGFKKLAIKQSPYNAFAGYNMSFGFDFGTPPAADLLAANVLISKGTISPTVMSTGVADVSDGSITATYPTGITGPGQSASDIALIAAYNSTLDEWTAQTNSDTRAAGTASIDLPATWPAGNSIVIYLGFYSPLSGESSDSVNASSTIVA